MVQHAEQYGSGGPDILDELREIRTQSSVQIGKEIIPFGLTPLLGTTPRSPTGIQFIDVVLGGGTRGGELYGFLAPSGGGKTSLSHQIGVNGARRKRHIFTFSYEESPMTNEYMVPLYSCATGMSRAVFDKVNPLSEMTPEQLEKLERARQEIGTYLHYVDMSGSFDNAGRGGAHELDAYIIEQRHAGIQPHGIIIDWLWPLFQRHYSDYKVDRKRILEERGLAQRLMDEFKSVASRHNCWIWLNHQVAPAATSKKTPAGWTDAAEFKSFAWLVNVCIALGTLDDKQIAPFNCSKNRNFRTSKTYVQLKGEISTFFPMGKDMEYSSRTKNYVEVGQGTCTPDMAAPGEPTAQMEPTFDKVRANYEGNDRIDL
jgi:RecA/RadA recombinase